MLMLQLGYLQILCAFTFQCYLSRTLLHLRYFVGSGAIHLVWDPVSCVRDPVKCHGLHLHSADLFSAFQRGLSLVVALTVLRRVS